MRTMRFLALIWACLVVSPVWGDPIEASEQPAEEVQVDKESIPTVELIPPEGAWMLGLSQELKVKIQHLDSIRIYFPKKPLVPGLALQEVREKKRVLRPGETESTMTLVMVPLRLDVQRLPTLDVAWRSLTDPSLSGTIPVDLGRAKVIGQVTDPNDAKLAAPPTGLNIRHRNMTLIMGLIALAAAVIAILLTLAIVACFVKQPFDRGRLQFLQMRRL